MAEEITELSKQYDPKQVEDKTYQFWMDGQFFHAQVAPEKPPYTIVMPPPNITGQLHMGHALDNTLQDILIRWRRMQGYEALWLPGTDHASIATEVKIVEQMKTEGLTKEELGREGFLKRAWAWKEAYGGRIIEQQKKLGNSCDWDRECFTMDERCSKAVREVFVRMYEKGLIYRGERMINWCPVCVTSLSDAEVEHEEQQGMLWHIRYPFANGEGFIEIATTRPETLLGDTAIAVNPKDSRYTALVGQEVVLPLVGRKIPVVADDYVDMEFGTGAVKITPAHDPNDFEVGERHNLPRINIMNDDATLNEHAGTYAGMSREAARKAIVADLKEQGFLAKEEEHLHNVGTCYRCNTIVEPRVSLQWFVKMDPLAKPAVAAVEKELTKFVPERFAKIYYNWMNNIRDWCISRQLWWGHQIPAWYCNACGEVIVSREDPTSCPCCGGNHLHRDEDVLDTWFSSALWPFSTLGWPDNTPDLSYFYPTNTLVTAYDIIFFWVARMIFSGIEHTGTVPFDTVFIHGLIRDEQGRKMSKSLGNGIDPLEIIDEYGADALRFMLSNGVSAGNDTRFSYEKVTAGRNFANKIWNAVRYVLMNLEQPPLAGSLPARLALEDQWVLSLYNQAVREITHALEQFEIGVAATKIYDFTWDIVCDWYIEITKSRIGQGGQTATDAQSVLVYLLNGILRLLHPIMPFITEELWQALPHNGTSIMVDAWPQEQPELEFVEEEREFQIILDAIRAIRARRAEMNVPPSRKTTVHIETDLPGIFAQGVPFIERLAYADTVHIGTNTEVEGAVQIVTPAARIFIPMDELVDMAAEKQRLQREIEKVEQEIALFTKKLSNPGFVEKAPVQVVEKDRARLAEVTEQKQKLEESLAAIC